MTPAGLSIRRPIFISSILILISILGWMGMKNMPLDLFPDVVEPTITIETFYDGAGPSEVEAQISKKMEEELSTIAGIKKISSSNKEGISIITVQFVLGVEIQAAEQDVRAKIGNIRKDLQV